ncbi:MAG: cytochrome c biogenesis protein CcsA [Ignavibacteria bacterium]|jgi:ABC-type transport system involved in cytochrome c biogenesis permease subunit
MFLIELLNIFLPVVYVLTISIYGICFFSKKGTDSSSLYSYRRVLLVSLILLQAVYFIVRSLHFGHPPITTIFEIFTLLSFSITLSYLYIEFKTNVRDTGFFILLIAGILQIISSIFIEELKEINPVLKNWLLGFHVTSAMIGYSAITVSGIYGFLYILLYNQIKENRFGSVYKRLPSLHLLEQLAFSAITFGFIFLTLTIIIGVVWLPRAIKDFSYFDPKLITTLIIWLLYTLGFLSRKLGNFKSKTIMTLAFGGFIFTIISITVVNVFLSSFHKFY